MVLIGKKSPKHTQFCHIWSNTKMSNNPAKYEVLIKQYLRAAPRKYRLNLEIAKKSNFSKLAQNEALRALVTKILF